MSYHPEQPSDQVFYHISGRYGNPSSVLVYHQPYQCIPHPSLKHPTYGVTSEFHPRYQYRDQLRRHGVVPLPHQEVVYHSSSTATSQHQALVSGLFHLPGVGIPRFSSRSFQAISSKSSENVNATWKETKEAATADKQKETKVTNKETMDSTGLVKVSSHRYDSDDSGIAESGSSLVSRPSSLNCDDTSSEDELWNERPSPDENNHSTSQINNSIVTSSSEQKSLHKETYWSIDMDDLYWRKLRRRLPSENIIATIASQVDYYLSDEYLVKDKYLLHQVRCKKDGYISIKLITSFKRLKSFTKDWAVVRSAIVRKSKTLQVSLEGLRVKRRTCLSDDMRKPRLLTSVLVIRIPEEYNFVISINSLFRPFGEVDYVRLIRPNKGVPSDLRNYATQVPDIGKTLCAVVNFESAQDALMAVKVLNHLQTLSCADKTTAEATDLSLQSSVTHYKDILKDQPSLADMRLALLGPRVRRTLYKRDRTKLCENEDVTNRKENEHDLDENKLLFSNFHSQTSSSPPSGRSRPVVVKMTPKQVLVIRQPKGPEDHKGFRLVRNISP